MDAELQPGTIFGRDFRVVRALRAGGMGAVYVVDQLSTGKQRALKVMAPELATDPAIRERFVLEARAASKIESDHVVEIVTAGVDETTGAPFLVMELLRGQELADALADKGPLPLGDAGEVLSQVGHALEQAHSHGIVHRDLKPENIFLGASRRRDVQFTAKILDFGIAKLVEDGLKKTGTQPLGTPLFMAPEQTDRKGRICPATDVWALGLIAFRLLTGRDFWLCVDGSLVQLLREIGIEPLPLASERARELGVEVPLPPGFDAWFANCVNRDIDARYPEAGAAVRAFMEICPSDAVKGHLSVRATGPMTGPVGVGTGQSVKITPSGSTAADDAAANLKTAAISTTTSASSVTGAIPKKGTPWAWIALPLAAAIGGGAWFMSRDKGPDAQGSSPSASPITSAAPASSGSAKAAVAAAGGCPEGMVFVQGGNMIMGAKDASEDAKVTHKVTLSSFCLDRTEVTAGDYQKCTDAGDCEKAPQDVNYPGMSKTAPQRFSPLCNARREGREKHPINCVDWLSAVRYCETRKARLPTEAEWEFAARGSGQRTFPWGDDPPSEKRLNACGKECESWGKANEVDLKPLYEGDDGFPATAPVGSFPDGKSSAGILDLAGNVWEWTADWYAPYTPDAATNPKGPDKGTERVVRGGAFNGWMADWAKPAYRWRSDPKAYNHGIGFRCAADAPGK